MSASIRRLQSAMGLAKVPHLYLDQGIWVCSKDGRRAVARTAKTAFEIARLAGPHRMPTLLGSAPPPKSWGF